MRLQSVIIPDDTQHCELYFRGNLSLAVGESLSLDTYFNSFPYTKYIEYTNVQQITFTCKIDGKAQLQFCVFNGTEQILCETEGEDSLSLSLSLADLPKAGFVYPKITALTPCRFLCGEYSSQCQASEISACIAICTYKREEYVLNNIELLKSAELSFIDRVFVVDNGNSLDHEALSDEFIKVLPNKNYGGSGGFTRGLIEAYDGRFSHIILMDDDIEFHTEILERMTVFAALLKNEYADAHFGTGMLSKNVPYIQYELGGADWSGRRVCGGKHNIDIRTPNALLENLSGNDIGYGAWWCFLMPVSDIINYGLPYPFFIKIDDVEYGLRTCSNTSPIITMNGIAVRHDDFDNKYSMHLEYYNVRNQLVLNTCHDRMPLFNALYRLLAVSFKHLVLYRYDSMPMILKAFDDYLQGVDFFINCDEEQLNCELIKNAPKLQKLTSIPEWDENMRNMERRADNTLLTPLSVLTLAGHIFPSFMLKKEIGAAPLSRTSSYDTIRRRAVIQYQLKGDTGVLVKRSFGKFIKYSFMVLGMAFKILFCYSSAKKSYQTRKNEIISLDFWRNHLGIK